MANPKTMLAALFSLGLISAPFQVQAEPKPDTVCDEAILMSYFPAPYVEKTLEKYKVPQGQRQAILSELAKQDKEVVPLVEEKASKMEKNPLKDPALRQEAIKIFRDTLFDLFSKTMQAHGVTNKEELMSMLNDIQQQKAEYFARCMEQSQKQRGIQEGKPNPFSRQEQNPTEK